MCASTDFEAWCGCGVAVCSESGAGGGGGVAVGGAAREGEIVEHEFLFEAACGEDLGTRLRGESDRADDVGMLEGVKAFACVGVPDFTIDFRDQLRSYFEIVTAG